VLKMAQAADDKRKAQATKHEGKNRQFAWEYEILEYRKRKKFERYAIFGGTCGIISLVVTVALNAQTIISFFR